MNAALDHLPLATARRPNPELVIISMRLERFSKLSQELFLMIAGPLLRELRHTRRTADLVRQD